MTKTLSNDIRKRVIRAVEGGLSARGAARKFAVSESFATKLVKRWRDTGSYEPGQRGGHRRSILEKEKDFLTALAEAHRDWTEDEMASWLVEHRNIKVHPTTVGRFLRRLGYSYKKNRTRRRTRA